MTVCREGEGIAVRWCEVHGAPMLGDATSCRPAQPSATEPDVLTFEEAITNVRTAYAMWESEFVVGPEERAAHDRQLTATLAALRAADSRPTGEPDRLRALIDFLLGGTTPADTLRRVNETRAALGERGDPTLPAPAQKPAPPRNGSLRRMSLDALRDEAERRGIRYWDDEWKRRDFIEALERGDPTREPEKP